MSDTLKDKVSDLATRVGEEIYALMQRDKAAGSVVSGSNTLESDAGEGTALSTGGIEYVPGNGSLLVFHDGLKLNLGTNYWEDSAGSDGFASTITIAFDASEGSVFDFFAYGGIEVEETEPVLTFTFTVNGVEGETDSIGVSDGAELSVDWGDGGSGLSHEWAESGTFTVNVSGTQNEWLNVSEFSLNCGGNVLTVDTRLPKTSIGSFAGFLSGNVSLTSVPKTLFAYNRQVADFSECFNGCESLASIPEDIFYYSPNVTNLDGCFGGCASLSEFTLNLTNSDNVESADGFIEGCLEGSKVIVCNADTVTYGTFYGMEGVDVVVVVAESSIPPGAILMYLGTTIPDGWLLCNGSYASRTIYANLYAAIKGACEDGDGSTTFTLPDFRDKLPEGAGTNSLGVSLRAGIPEIYGKFRLATSIVSNSSATIRWSYDGVLFTDGEIGSNCVGVSASTISRDFVNGLTFTASNYNSLYNGSSTVQPPSIIVNFLIKT